MSAKHSHSDCASRIDINALSSSSVSTQWTDMSLQDHSYTDVDHFSLSKEKLTQTNTKSFDVKGVNCNTLNVLMLYDNITTDSKSLLHTGLSLTAFQTLVQVIEQSAQPFKFSIPVRDQVLLTLLKVKLNLVCDIGCRFGISESHATNFFNSWLPILAEKTEGLGKLASQGNTEGHNAVKISRKVSEDN